MSTTVIFRVRSPPSAWGSSLCITGSDSHLTDWGLGHSLSFSPPFYTLSLTLPSNLYFEYKYISVIDGSIQAWEQLPHGNNRHIQTPPPGYTLVLDDGIVGEDSYVCTTLTPPKEMNPQLQTEQPISTEEAELALQLRRVSAYVDAVRHGVRTLKGLPPADEPPDIGASPDDCTDAYALVGRCLDDGFALMAKLRSVKSKRRGVHGVWGILIAVAFAVIAMGVAMLIVSPQVIGEMWKVSEMGFRNVRGVVEGVWEMSWKDILRFVWSGVVKVGEKVRARFCEAAGWPGWCGKKPEEGLGEQILGMVGRVVGGQ